jgi:hypothetical protein
VGADLYVASSANVELQIDPLTGNRYLYAGANPANMLDDGHKPKAVAKSSKQFCFDLSWAGLSLRLRVPGLAFSGRGRKVTCQVKCQIAGSGDCWKLGYKTGIGTAFDRDTACKIAKKSISDQLPKGEKCYTRHCQQKILNKRTVEVENLSFPPMIGMA